MGEKTLIPLSVIAHGRSGDKGDIVNIALIANQIEWFPILKKYITKKWLKNIFKDEIKGEIQIFPVPGIGALNCVIGGALQGGGTVSLNKDAQGKLLGQIVLQAEIGINISEAKKLGIIND